MNEWPLISSALETQDALSAALREIHGAGARLECWAARPVSKRGKHRTVRFDLDARVDGEPRARRYQWVGKVYEGDDEAKKVAAVLGELAAADCSARGSATVPGVIAYHAPCRLLLLTYETGESVVRAITQHGESVLRTIGEALAALHATPVSLDAVIQPAALLNDLREKIAPLATGFPAETKSLLHILAELERHAPGGPASQSFLHGDLGPSQLLWQSGRVVVLDFDDCARGDPAFDLGNLFTQLHRLTLRKPGKLPDFATLRRTILNAYQRCSAPDPDLAARVAWYEPVTLLRKIRFLASDTTRHPDAETIRRRRAEAIRLLEELPPMLSAGEFSGGFARDKRAESGESNPEPNAKRILKGEMLCNR